MDTELNQTFLIRFLASRSPIYYGKVVELLDAIKNWLAYIPHSFPHYTRHTVEHSIEIIRQLSFLLFEENDPDKPVVRLSPMEAYILVAAALLHDSGMVASDREKSEILLSDKWREWTSAGGGAPRWKQIQQFRQGNHPADEALRHFLSDIQTRFLLAEFIRRGHHRRAAEILTLHQSTLGRFAFDDPHLLRAINEVCVAHGLKKHELEDRERFPDRRDIRGDQVNLCFLAILLRMGDLLDIAHDRACALLLNAASPLPADSLAHWTQYQRITHRLSAPDRIEITAECQNQDEHRYLRDWFQWLEEEVNNAAVLRTRWRRHDAWYPPHATLRDPEPTIKILRAPGATYIFGDWKLELDHEAIFERLIYDVHERPETFIRELIQNALDANRCRIYSDYQQATGEEPPEYPTHFPEEWRQNYPVHMALEEREFTSELSGEKEKRQVLVVEDVGIGMDQEIIQKYFLQIGRSYYTTHEFRRRYKFYPTSRFGVGFLSVFAVSDHVEVETYKPEGSDGPLHLTLSGPRNYLLMDRGKRTGSGTRIEVVLQKPMAPGNLTDLVSGWCKRVEFPIRVNDLETEKTVVAESLEDFVYEMTLVTDPKASFAVRAFSVNRAGIEGELYVFAYITEQGESWVKWQLAQEYPSMHPRAYKPPFPGSLICINGISYNPYVYIEESSVRHSSQQIYREPLGVRLDYWGPLEHVPLSRTGSISWSEWRDPAIISRWQEILDQHLAETPFARGEDGWEYKLKLAALFPIPEYWVDKPGTIRIYQAGQSQLLSLAELKEKPVITTVINFGKYEVEVKPEWNDPTPALGRLYLLPTYFGDTIFNDRFADKIQWLESDLVALCWRKGKTEDQFLRRRLLVEEFPEKSNISISLLVGYGSLPGASKAIFIRILNKKNPFVRWLLQFGDACLKGDNDLEIEHFEKLIELIPLAFTSDFLPAIVGIHLKNLETYLSELRQLPGLPENLKPPEIEFTPEMFGFGFKEYKSR